MCLGVMVVHTLYVAIRTAGHPEFEAFESRLRRLRASGIVFTEKSRNLSDGYTQVAVISGRGSGFAADSKWLAKPKPPPLHLRRTKCPAVSRLPFFWGWRGLSPPAHHHHPNRSPSSFRFRKNRCFPNTSTLGAGRIGFAPRYHAPDRQRRRYVPC